MQHLHDFNENIEQLANAVRTQEHKAAAYAVRIYKHWQTFGYGRIPSQLPPWVINDVEEVAKRSGLDLDHNDVDYGTDYWAARSIIAALSGQSLKAALRPEASQ
jgi:hypothetical protein